MNKKFFNSIFNVLMSNMMIVLSGIISGFLLPKLLGVTDYGYYKIFNLYITYIVFFDLGIANGIYLLYGGYELKDLPKRKFRFYFKVLFSIQLIALLGITIFALASLQKEYRFIFLMVGIYLLVNNIANYFEKISIMTGEFKAVVKRNVLKSILNIVIVFILWWFIHNGVNIQYFKIYTALFVILYSILAIQYSYSYRSLIVGETASFIEEKNTLLHIIKIGMMLLLADMIANLILTLDRQFVSLLFDVDTYSIYSFAYSMLRIVILAVSAISSVLYPTLKRMTSEEMKASYGYSVAIVGMIAFACQLTYYPLCIIVKWFLPNYSASLPIFRVLFPSITINSIISMIMVNHYKALQKQKIYFVFSAMTLIAAALLNVLAYFITQNPIGFSVASVITMFFWYVISDAYLVKKYGTSTSKYLLYLLINTFGFYLISGFFKNYFCGLGVNILFFGVICGSLYHNEVKKILLQFKRK